MARPIRIEYPGAIYHITSRGNAQEAIYHSDKDREQFLSILEKACQRYQWQVFAYCLMDNHYHLMVETIDSTLSKGMRHINGVYTQWFNHTRAKRRVGHVFQGRFKGILVDKESYLLELCRYVVLNPVRANMVEHPSEYIWSSYQQTSRAESKSEWLNSDWVLSQFSKQKKRAVEKYKQFVEAGVETESPLKKRQGQMVLGSDEFVAKALGKLSKEKQSDLSEIPKKQRKQVYALSTYFKKHTKDQAVAKAYYSGGYSQREIGDYLKCHYSTVSRILKKVEWQGKT